MVRAPRGIHSRKIADTPFAVIDFETTGLAPGLDRVVEVSVVRVEPGREPRLILDTLVNPSRSVAATEIHGITDADVADAPQFRDIVGDLIDALAGCVVAAYNVYFDVRFLEFELGLNGVRHEPPHLCLMYLRPLLDLGSRCRLCEACDAHGIELSHSHVAGDDVLASGRLLNVYLDLLRDRQVQTFADLATRGKYKFLSSLLNDPFADASSFQLNKSGRRKSRCAAAEHQAAPTSARGSDGLREYWDALKMAVTDLEIGEEELSSIAEIRTQYGLKTEHIRVIHARAFAGVIGQYVSDQWLDDKERFKLKRFHQCLSLLGWAPGE